MFIGVHWCSLVFHWCSLVFHWCSLVFIGVPLVWCFRLDLFKRTYGGVKQARTLQKARSYMLAHVCNVQNKFVLLFVTSLSAVRMMKQTSRIVELERTSYRYGSTQRQNAKGSRSERICVIVNAEFSATKINESTSQLMLRFWKNGSIVTTLLYLFKELMREMLISDTAKVEIVLANTHLRTLLL